MFLHLVVLLSLSWPHVIGNANLQDESYDQVATASENVAESARQRKEFRDQLIPSMIDTTVYENSNGFVPMLVTSTTESRDASTTEAINVTRVSSSNTSNSNVICNDAVDKGKNIASDAYSTKDRISLNFPDLSNNRRSFQYQGSQNEFELLKVKNDTPIVANYPDFYEDPTSSVETKDDTQLSRSRENTNGEKMQDYSYGMVLNADKDRSSYEDYYPRNVVTDKEKKSQVKANVNYHQQDALSYDGHGQTSTTQNGPTTYFSRSNQRPVPADSAKNHEHLYDSVGSTSQISNSHQKFSRPVVVAEPSYNYDYLPRQKSNTVDDYQTSRIIDSDSAELSHYAIRNRDGRYRSDEDSRDISDERDYTEYAERPRRVQKTRKHPSRVDSKRLQKEHRGSLDSAEYESKRHHSRSKSHRQRTRNSWSEHRDQEESYEDSKNDDRGSRSETRHKQSLTFKPSSAWNQVSPNLEISHSNGVEIGQLEKPKIIVPLNVNLVPVANFDHSTAIGNSQGFDVSNAVLHNIVNQPINAVTTSQPVINAVENGLDQDTKIRVSSPVPDIIVGQNSYQNSIQAILPQTDDQNNFSSNFKPQFMSTTVAPVYAVTPGLQSIAVQSASTPRPAYVDTSSQQYSANQVQTNVPQIMVPQPTLQTYPTLLQTPIPGSNFNIQVNPHGMHGQNFIDSNLQMQPVSTMSTVTPTAQTIPVTKFNLLPESHGKKTQLNTNFLGSANVAVPQTRHRHYNGNYYYFQNPYNQQHRTHAQGNLYQQVQKHAAPKTKTYVQTTHILPAVLHPVPTFTTLSTTPSSVTEHQNQQYVKIQNTDNHSMLKKLPSLMYQNVDNAGSHTTSSVNVVNASPGSQITDTAHLPHVGTGNVEILNPNIKPSPLDTTLVNSYETMHYPATVLTTSIPMFTTTSFVTARPALFSASTTESTNVQNLVNSLTEIGSKNSQQTDDSKAFQSQDRPVFNPINFVPNLDLMKSQTDLNSNLHTADPLQPNLNLVPLIPGGNFFKPSFMVPSELFVKPKLNLDLIKYAEQMFKESLKTMYNSQKWNNDRKPGSQARQNATDSIDIAKLKNELQRLKATLFDSKKNKDQLEGHQSETKVQTAELPQKKPDSFPDNEEFHPKHSESSHGHYGKNKPRYRRPDQDKHKELKGERFKETKHIKDFMTPPKPYRSKGHFHDKPGKKRPHSGPTRYNHHGHYHGPRSYPRHHFSHKTSGPEAFGSNHEPVYSNGFSHRDNAHNSRQRGRPEFRKGPPLDSHSSFSAPLVDKNGPYKGFKQHKGTETVNQSKMHNLLGMWMKNKQLPEGNNPSYFRDKDQLKRFFEDEKQRLQKQFYDDSFKDY